MQWHTTGVLRFRLVGTTGVLYVDHQNAGAYGPPHLPGLLPSEGRLTTGESGPNRRFTRARELKGRYADTLAHPPPALPGAGNV